MTDATHEMRAALGQLLDQVDQMKGLFPDEDGTIAAAVKDAEDALEAEDAPIVVVVSGGLVQSASKDGKPFIVTVHDYDVDGDDPTELERDSEGDLFNRYQT